MKIFSSLTTESWNQSCLSPLCSVSVQRCGKCEPKFLYRTEFECIQLHLPKVENLWTKIDSGWANTVQNTTKMPVFHLGLSGWNRRRYWWHCGLLLSKKAWTYDKWIINSKILGRKHSLSFHERPYFPQKEIYFISLITFIFHSTLEKHLLTFR